MSATCVKFECEINGFITRLSLVLQMVSVEDGGGRLPLVMDKDPEGLCEIVEQRRILDATLVREVSTQP